MSISLEEARRKLDILEKSSDEPELILTDLFSEGVSGMNFLYQVRVNGKYIIDYLKEYLNIINPFKNCIIMNNSHTFSFYFPSLSYGKDSNFKDDDLIAKIDVDDRTYRIFTKCINDYEDVVNKEYKLEELKLDDRFQKLTDLSFKNRLHQIKEELHSDRKRLVKLSNVCFWLVMTNKRRKNIKKALEKESKRVENSNQYNKERYEQDIERQIYYKEYAPNHIKRIRTIQKEIEIYLKEIGYVEDVEMSMY